MKPRDARALTHRIEHALVDALGHAGPARLLVGVSGGPDSSALLYALAERASRHDWTLIAAHVDHGIAGEAERAGFASAVEALAGRLGVELRHERADVPQRMRDRGESAETAAREARYERLAALADETRVDAVVVGHTLDDQAETVLLHLVRGSGLDGLAAMAPRSVLPVRGGRNAPPLLRPMLDVGRAETAALCALWEIDVVADPANADPAFARNRVRSELMPVLRGFNPAIVRALVDLATDAQRDRRFLAEAGEQAFGEVASHDVAGSAPEARSVELSRRALAALPEAIAIRVLRLGVTRIGADTPTHERTQALWRLAREGGHRVELGGGAQARARGDLLCIWRD